jgi:hypothetical protein
MNLESQQKIQNLYLELIDLDETRQTIINHQDTAIKSIPLGGWEDAIKQVAKAIDYQVVLKTLNRDKTLLLEEIKEEIVEIQQNTQI